jgi:hypothetical protein
MKCSSNTIRKILAATRVKKPLIGLDEPWVTAKVLSSLIPASQPFLTKEPYQIVPALCFADFLTTGDLDNEDLSNAKTKALSPNFRKLILESLTSRETKKVSRAFKN